MYDPDFPSQPLTFRGGFLYPNSEGTAVDSIVVVGVHAREATLTYR
jgi:hypothetical protein